MNPCVPSGFEWSKEPSEQSEFSLYKIKQSYSGVLLCILISRVLFRQVDIRTRVDVHILASLEV